MRWTIIAMILLLVLLVACNKEVSEEITTTSLMMTDEGQNMKLVELRLDGTFHPSVITVNEGDLVKIQFMDDEVYTFSLPEYGIMEPAKNNYVQFTANKKGTFSYACLDCDEKATGILKVI